MFVATSGRDGESAGLIGCGFVFQTLGQFVYRHDFELEILNLFDSQLQFRVQFSGGQIGLFSASEIAFDQFHMPLGSFLRFGEIFLHPCKC